ncbi:HlyD family efflux transporter periplasmic adaptor subunit [Spirulina major]|uniref:HlyD family efflux transporter periplasmic adaptor subunit n=1 Tax=Spirulina major TaxID=270636 RepID=UPI00093438C9|nr:HlyD family efflux transporter periplasmic adaptor subunit [Spirulina major]
MSSLPLTPPTSKPWRRWTGLGLAVLGLTAGGLYWQQQSVADVPAASPIQVVERETVTALGRLEPQGEAIQVQASTASQEQRIAALRVGLGDRVSAGQIIAVLDGRDRLAAAVAEAQSRVQIAIAQLNQVQAGAKPGAIAAQQATITQITADRAAQLQAQQAVVAEREAELENAIAEFRRYDSLYQDGAISALDHDQKQLARDTAQRRLETARAELTRLQTTQAPELQAATATLEQLAEVRTVDVQAAQAQVAQAQAAVQQAQANLEQLDVRSPRDGVVLDVYTQGGEVISPDGIIELGQTAQMVAIAEIYQSDIQAIRPGQTARITSAALREPLTGTVTQIGAKVQQQEVVNTDPSSNIDARVIEVTIHLDPDASDRARSFTNLQVEIEIALGD